MTTAGVLIIGASEVVTARSDGRPKRGPELADLGVVPRGAVAIRDGRISAVGSRSDIERHVRGWGDIEVVDVDGRVVLPGFVDAHTHLIFDGERASEFDRRFSTSTDYLALTGSGQGAIDTVRRTRAADDLVLRAGIERRLRRLLEHGTTTVEVKSGYGLSVEEELRHLRILGEVARSSTQRIVATALLAHYAPPPEEDRVSYVERAVALCPLLARERLATSVDVFADPTVFSTAECVSLLEAAKHAGLGRRVHADQLRNASGAELAARFSSLSADHLGFISDAGIAALAASSTVGVLIPGSRFFLEGERTPPVRRMIEEGVVLALATDCNPGTSPMSSLPLAASLACAMFGISTAEALAAATINAAWAVGLQDEVGSLEPGKRGDAVVVDADSYRELTYRFGENLVSRVVVGGRTVVTRNGPGAF